MPRRDGPPLIPLELLPPEERALVQVDAQAHWYRLVGSRARYLSVLDVGAGQGAGLAILRDAGCGVRGIDPGPACDEVERGVIEDVADDSVDVACAMDVIEHIEDDEGFLRGLMRVARVGVFLSTPNFWWEHARCQNPHHVREYTACELGELLLRVSAVDHDAWSSDVDLVPRAVPDISYVRGQANFGVWIWHRGRLV